MTDTEAGVCGLSIAAAPVTCVLADEYGVVRDGMYARVQRIDSPRIQVVGAACAGDEALWMINIIEPTIAIVDLHLPRLDALELARAVRSVRARTKVIVYVAHADPLLAPRALAAGVRAFVGRGTQHDQLGAAVRAVLRGEEFVDAAVGTDLPAAQGASLWQHEIDVLRLLALGMSNAEIAVQLDVHRETVKSRVQRIVGKLETTNRTSAVAAAIRRGIVT